MPTPTSSVDDLKALLDSELAREQIPPQPSAPKATSPAEPYVVQGPTLFQDSLLWQWQRDFFTEAGPEAWRQGIVPHYITSSSYAAHSYAQLVLSYQQDRALAGDFAPLTVMELGGGSGQFTFHFLRHYAALTLPHLPPLRYLFTDVVQANLDFVRQHPAFAEALERGLLEVALFDVTDPQPLALQVSESQWLEAPTEAPLLTIANYLWDTLPMELWRFREGQAYPLQVALSLPQAPEDELGHPHLRDLMLEYSEAAPPATLPPLVDYYRQHLTEGEVLIPAAGLACLDWLAERTQGQLLLLSGDKPLPGPSAAEKHVGLVHHGSFSLQVNFEAFCGWAQQQGGQAFLPDRGHRSLQMGLFTARAIRTGPYLQQACQQWLYDFHAGDQFILKRSVERHYQDMSPEEVLAYVRFSRYDPKVLRRGLPTLMEYVNGFGPAFLEELMHLIDRVWENYYPLGEEPDLAFLIGSLLYEVDLFAEAIRYFEYSVQYYGPDEGTLANLESCREMMG